jgi:RimJ/RimL family protein N-acetyltransferase
LTEHRDVAGPRLRKAARITGRRLVLRDAGEADAAFIHALRTDSDKAQHLSAVSDRLQDQVDWLRRYAGDEDQAYFVIEDDGGPVGTVRLYDARGDSFCWGSWIIRDGAPASHAFESALIVYRYALSLGFNASHFDVRRANQSVWRFHERFGARRVGETADDYLYTIDRAAILASLERYARYLPGGITVEPR